MIFGDSSRDQYNVNKAKNLFKKKLSSRHSSGVSDEEQKEADSKLGKICQFLLGHPDMLGVLEAEHGSGDAGQDFTKFLASFHVQQAASEDEVSKPSPWAKHGN